MDIDELNKHYERLKSFDSDTKSIDGQVVKIKKGVQNVEDGFMDFSNTLFDSSGKTLNNAKNKYDIVGSAAVGVAGLATAVIGGTFGLIGNIYADMKGSYLINKLNSKKREVALAKIDYARESLNWGNKNIGKFLTILKNDLSVDIPNSKIDKKKYYQSRQLSYEICYKCLFMIKLSNRLITTYENWISKKYLSSVGNITKNSIIKEIFYGKNGVFDSIILKDKFLAEISKQPINAKYLFLLENEDFFNYIPLSGKDLISATKILNPSSLAFITINNNKSYQNTVTLERDKKNKRNKNRIIFLLLLFYLIITVIYWGLLGWWNLLVILLVLVLSMVYLE